MTKEMISLIANVSFALSFITALIFGIAEVRAAARDRRERLTLDTLGKFQTRRFAELIYFIVSTRMPATQREMEELPEKERINIIQFAQQMESLGMLVAERLINIDLVDKTLGSLVTSAWEKYKPSFVDIREKQPDPFLGEYFQWLAEQIDKRMRETPRKPFHETGTRPAESSEA